MAETTQILWVDDDNDDEGLLGGLLLHFRARGIDPVRAHGFEDGKRELERILSGAGKTETVSLLCDVVLPQVLGVGALAWDLGIRLALDAAELGVHRIGFLTVVQLDEIQKRVAGLNACGCDWRVFSKPGLLENNNISRIITFLTSPEHSDHD